ncbi:MAG: Maf family nucleotide pyrophosphatase [Planctomycetota bacterium]|jgi:septum formation protein
MFEKNKILTLLPLIIIFIILFLSFENGCDRQQADIYSMPFAASTDKKIFLAVQTYNIENDRDKFVLFSAAKPYSGNWAKPKSFQGKLSGVLPGKDNITIVFETGAVIDCRYESGKYSLEKRKYEKLKILSAGGSSDNILAVTEEKNQLALYKFTDEGWLQEGPLLKPAAAFINPHVCILNGLPHLIWQQKGAAEKSRKLRWARLEKGTWRSLAAPDSELSGNITKFKPLDEDLFLMSQNSFSASIIQSKDISVLKYSGKENVWREIPAIKIPEKLDNSFTPLADFIIEGEKIYAVLSSGNALSIAEGNPVTLRLAEFKPVIKSSAPDPADELTLMLFFLFIFLLVGFFQILARKKIQQRPSAVPQKQNASAARPVPSLDKNTAPAVGGIASPMERGAAFAIDLLITTPFLFAFLAAQNIKFNSLEQMKELIIPASVFYNFSFMLYAAITEFIWNQTVGKKAFGLYVRAAEGGRADKTRIIIRNLFRGIDNMLIPGLNIPFFPAIISMIFSKTSQRVGDRFAKTVVVRKVPIEFRDIILASGSPRRRQIMNDMNLTFEVIEPDIDEKTFPALSCTENTMQLARQKADSVGNKLNGSEVIIAADTVIEFEGRIIGKPETREDAVQILTTLSGSRHQVITGLAVWDRATGKKVTAAEVTEIQMNPLTPEEIAEYVASGEADDKAGAYAIQDEGGKFIRYITGSYSNVVGLPVELLRTILDDLEV